MEELVMYAYPYQTHTDPQHHNVPEQCTPYHNHYLSTKL
jgi:hypothetical protein